MTQSESPSWTEYSEILTFWFEEVEPKQWYSSSPEFDALVDQRFAGHIEQAARGAFAHWHGSARGILAEVIILDQFSRNVFRGTPAAFAQDARALRLARQAVEKGLDQDLKLPERTFLYMPYMHSEEVEPHEEAMRLFATPGMERSLDFEVRHKAIIDRFGRYPHRNAILGRPSTTEELEFLKQPGSSF